MSMDSEFDGQFRNNRLFIGCYPTGFVYADRKVEVHGDYKRLAYLHYGTLEADIEDDVPSFLLNRINDHINKIRSLKGTSYQIAGNCVITLGYAS